MIGWRFLVALSFVLAFASEVRAHERSISHSEWTETQHGFDVSFSISARELTRWVDAEVEVARTLARELSATRGGAPCVFELGEVKRRASRAGMMSWTLAYECQGQGQLTLTSQVLAQVAPHHIHFVRMTRLGAAAHEHVLTDGHRMLVLAPHASIEARASSFVSLGVEHIASGYDHLAFLMLLVLPRRGLRELLLIVTGFTVGHSITLALAALGVLTVDATIVEAFVAGSIVLAAIDAVWPRSLAWTCGLSTGFGLVHGLAFASALNVLTLGPAQRVTALFGFNLGVELGQLAIAALTVTAFGLIRTRSDVFAASLVRYTSGVIAGAALVLCFSRALVGAS